MMSVNQNNQEWRKFDVSLCIVVLP